LIAIDLVERARLSVSLGESHFREFKSALHGPPGAKVPRPKSEIAVDISQTLVAFANADGGELLLGVEDAGAITGLDGFTEDDLAYFEDVPRLRVHADTPLANVRKSRVLIDEKLILYFTVPKSTQFIHLTSDGRCLQRRDLESIPVASEAIEFDRRERASRDYDRQTVDGVSADDLDLDLVRTVADQVLKGMTPEKCLQYLDLAEYGLSSLRYKRAALLLFAKDPLRWHPRMQIRILKVAGDEVRTGENYNVTSDELVAGNVLSLVESAWEKLRPHLIQTKIDKDARFERRSIYPELACREALLNAIAHRDYSDEGKGIEVYIFESNLTIKNPGGLLSSISIADIDLEKGVHESRNTHIARVLRELGYMRELGEGMRRIYDLMHKNELAKPTLVSDGRSFEIKLTHRALYSDKDSLWLAQFEDLHLDREQKAIVLLGQEGRVFSAKQVWEAVGIVDTEHYRKLVDSLLSKGVLKNRVERARAKRLASRQRVPFREFPRYGVELPGVVMIAHPKAAGKARAVARASEDDFRSSNRRIRVSNLPASMTKDELYRSFEVIGEIAEIYFPKQGANSRGFAFLEFNDESAAQKALAADGLEYEGRKLVIRAAQPRSVRPA